MNDLHHRLLEREMTRKEFLQYSAGAIVVLFGFGNFLSLFKTHLTQDKRLAQQEAQHGFGSRKFGA
jgi:hypothetical protein